MQVSTLPALCGSQLFPELTKTQTPFLCSQLPLPQQQVALVFILLALSNANSTMPRIAAQISADALSERFGAHRAYGYSSEPLTEYVRAQVTMKRRSLFTRARTLYVPTSMWEYN